MRYPAPADRLEKPGPGAYMSEKVNTKTSSPEYSFGTRHSKYVFETKHDADIPVRPLPYWNIVLQRQAQIKTYLNLSHLSFLIYLLLNIEEQNTII